MSSFNSASSAINDLSKRSGMSRTANVVAWAPRFRGWSGTVGEAIAIAAVSLVAAQYLAGFLFLAWCRQDVRTAQPFTVARYAYYYGTVIEVRKRLWISSAV